MKYPKLIWNYSPETEILRVIWSAFQIRNGFYFSKGWLVLPCLVSGHSQTVYFPQRDFNSVPHFWGKIMQIEKGLSWRDPEFIKQVAELFVERLMNYSSLKRNWETVYPKFARELFYIMPGVFNDVEDIQIRPTIYGVQTTSFSENIHQKNAHRHIVVYIRNDIDYSHIAESVLIDRMYNNRTYKHFNWEEKESIMDFLLGNTCLAKLFPKHTGTKKTPPKTISEACVGQSRISPVLWIW